MKSPCQRKKEMSQKIPSNRESQQHVPSTKVHICSPTLPTSPVSHLSFQNMNQRVCQLQENPKKKKHFLVKACVLYKRSSSFSLPLKNTYLDIVQRINNDNRILWHCTIYCWPQQSPQIFLPWHICETPQWCTMRRRHSNHHKTAQNFPKTTYLGLLLCRSTCTMNQPKQ